MHISKSTHTTCNSESIPVWTSYDLIDTCIIEAESGQTVIGNMSGTCRDGQFWTSSIMDSYYFRFWNAFAFTGYKDERNDSC